MLRPSDHLTASNLANTGKVLVNLLIGGVFTILYAIPVLAGTEFTPWPVTKGALLVASPSLTDQNFHQSVVLILEHGPAGTVGVILNRPTKVLLSEALPNLPVLKGTTYPLFAGGPVEAARMHLLFRLREAPTDARSLFDGVYVGGTPDMLARIITQPKPTEAFRAFAGYASWAPRQLEAEMGLGAWAALPPDAASIFDQDPATLWKNCLRRLQAPRVISSR